MPDPKDLKQFEAALMTHLSQGAMDKAMLKTTSATIMNLKRQGLIIDQIHVKGQPVPGFVTKSVSGATLTGQYTLINGIVDPNFWTKFPQVGHVFKRFEVFPYGIINPEGFRFEAAI